MKIEFIYAGFWLLFGIMVIPRFWRAVQAWLERRRQQKEEPEPDFSEWPPNSGGKN